jgi:RHS repeat-associated protein
VKIERGERFGVVTDHLGTPRMMADETGALAWKAQLDVYGVAQNDVALTGCPWRWPGQYEDAETGLSYNRFRYYDPDAGRYVSQDPIGLDGGLALYPYVQDPLRFIDPFGLAGCGPKEAQNKVRRGQGPRGIHRIDSPKVKGEQWHAHLGPGEGSDAVNLDGTWKHGDGKGLTSAIRGFLVEHGWNL